MSPVEAALRAENAQLRETLSARDALIADLQARLARLEHRSGADSTNSATPPSKDSIAARAKRRADRKARRDNGLSSRERSEDRTRGGQVGHPGSGLVREPVPDRVEEIEAPMRCRSCSCELGADADAGCTWSQSWDIPRIELFKLEYRLPRRRCGGCGTVTVAAPPHGQAGSVSYGPNVNAAAVFLGNHGNVPVELSADLMATLLGADVSSGFIVKAAQRLSTQLEASGFDAAIKAALRAEPVLGADESPVNVVTPDIDEDTGEPQQGSPHLMVINSPDRGLVFYTPMPSRSGEAIEAVGVLDGYTGYLVRDGYSGYQRFEDTLAGVQQCCVHIIRRCKRVLPLGPGSLQRWAKTIQQVLRQANAAVQAAKAAGRDSLDPDLLAGLRARYDQAVEFGIAHNRHRSWDDGNHPAYALARWLKAKADQVWLFTTTFAVPWTSNSTEQSVRGPKRHQAISGYWQTSTTMGHYCRNKSYLTTARNNGIHPIDAIHAALAGNPWLPTPAPD
jgi:transposase